MKSQKEPDQKNKNKINGLILADCYALAFFVYKFISELLSTQSTAHTGNTPAGISGIIYVSLAYFGILEFIILLSLIALLFYGLWALLRKFAFKNFAYTETTFQKVRKTSIIICVILVLILIIQGMQY